MVRVEGLTFGFDAPLLEDASFEVERGEVFGILGPSGTGKSTLLRVLAGLIPPWSGCVEIEGLGRPELELDAPPHFGVLFESGALLGSRTVGDNLALPLVHWKHIDRETAHAVVRAKLRMVGLTEAIDQLPDELSSGMRKRVALVLAQILDPPLMFLDEPTSGLDPITSAQVVTLVRTLCDTLGTTMVLVSHDLYCIHRIVDRCVLLDEKERAIIARGPPDRLRDESDDPRVRAFFHRGDAQGGET